MLLTSLFLWGKGNIYLHSTLIMPTCGITLGMSLLLLTVAKYKVNQSLCRSKKGRTRIKRKKNLHIKRPQWMCQFIRSNQQSNNNNKENVCLNSFTSNCTNKLHIPFLCPTWMIFMSNLPKKRTIYTLIPIIRGIRPTIYCSTINYNACVRKKKVLYALDVYKLNPLIFGNSLCCFFHFQ